jgi:hypothetical protein
MELQNSKTVRALNRFSRATLYVLRDVFGHAIG